MQSLSTTWKRVAGLGAISGLRASAGLSVISWTAAHGGYHALRRTPFSILASRKASYIMGASLVSEALADKIAPLPSRAEPSGLASRAVFGALTGALVSTTEDAPLGLCVLLGSGMAMATGAAASTLRTGVSRRLGVPDALLGLIEDALIVVSLAVFRRSEASDAASS